MAFAFQERYLNQHWDLNQKRSVGRVQARDLEDRGLNKDTILNFLLESDIVIVTMFLLNNMLKTIFRNFRDPNSFQMNSTCAIF